MTPLCDILKNYAARNPARFHMPGHKGGPLPLPELSDAARLDVTEIPGTGNLYLAGEPFDSAQKPWAERFGFDHCQFLTGGSTMGIHTGLSLLCAPGDQILVDRNCHRAVFNAMALLDLEPVYLERPWLEQENLIGPITPEQVESALKNHSNVKTVCITSPTYAGVLSDIEAISRVVHAHGGRLFVDGAHGAHLPFLGLTPFAGADGVVVSAHKTLPALGQAALLFTSGADPDRVRRMASVFGTSSPSYPILASMDAARAWLEGDGARAYRQTALRVAHLRSRFPSLAGDLSLDPARLTLNVQDGPSFARCLEEQNIFPEMEDGGHVVFICTPQDLEENFDRLERALEGMEDRMGPCPPLPSPPLPERACSLREALFAPTQLVPLYHSAGRVSAAQIAPYPPGVPVVAPGERISEKELAYFRKIGYNSTDIPVIVSSGGDF